MTERTLSTLPPIAQSQHASNSPYTHNFESALVAADSGAEEPYTIKCVCKYTHADTETICCDKCETWQHFQCYYDGDFAAAAADDFQHDCVDCHPRYIDPKRIREQQMIHHEKIERQSRGEDKKSKRPQTKSHKKSKPSEVVTNGHHDHDAKSRGGGTHDQTKRTKSTHRSQHSISSQAGTKRSPSSHSRHNSHALPLSPATTPPELPNDFVVHTYSDQFQYLWQTDPGPAELQANSFGSLSVTNKMSSWVHDESALRQDTGVRAADAYSKLKPDADLSKPSFYAKLQIHDKIVQVRGVDVRYRYLTIRDDLRNKAQLLGELKGVVGFQKDYYEQEREAWARTCHPGPFVFFPTNLPLYIDTRHEGSLCRYVRRSCQPNTSLETFITNGSEYHFVFVNESELQAGQQIAMSWDFKFPKPVEKRYLRLLGLSDESDGTEDQEMTAEEYQHLSDLINNVLSDYGGCACDLGNDCAFVRFHRNYNARLQAQSQPKKAKKPRKIKQHVSPVSTGHATNSRDASEGHAEQYDEEDENRSISGSTKPRSRDLTPPSNGTHLVSDRDKRKLADIEKAFEQQDKQPPKKKKRGSDGPPPLAHTGSGQSSTQRPRTKGTSRATTTTQHGAGKDSRDGSRHSSQSPVIEVSPKTKPVSGKASRQGSKHTASRPISPVPKVQYAEAGTQTDPDPEGSWYSPASQQKRKFVPLSRRLTQNHRRKWEIEQKRRALLAEQMELASRMQELTATPSPLPPPARVEATALINAVNGTVSPVSATQRTTLDGPAPPSPDVKADAPPSSMPPPPTWPVVLKSTSVSSSTSAQPDQRPANLSIQLPAQSQLSPGALTTPSPAGSMTQSPLGTNYPSAFLPSVQARVGLPAQPVKKKLSLKDYASMKKAASATPAHRTESAVPTLQTSSTISEEVKGPLPEKPASTPLAPVADSKSVDTIMSDAPPSVNGVGAKHSDAVDSL